MSWAVGYDDNWKRDVGYGVPSICDYPGCNKRIDRGLSYVCGNNVGGGEHGCGLHFCGSHLYADGQLCDACYAGRDPFDPTPDLFEWILWKLSDNSWEAWREDNPEATKKMKELIGVPVAMRTFKEKYEL
jgi:hypothetical protein